MYLHPLLYNFYYILHTILCKFCQFLPITFDNFVFLQAKARKIDMDTLLFRYHNLLKEIDTGFLRYLHGIIPWPPLIGGKTRSGTFFLNQLQVNHNILSSTISDFLVDDTYTFELGGKNKQQKQIEHADNAFVVKDDVERGMFNIIPLWHFGLMY